MKRLHSLVLLSGLLVCLVAGSPKVCSDEPVKNPGDDVLKRFVDECTSIKPGTDTFPLSFQFGGLNEGPLALKPAEVTLSVPFRICKYEVTQELYEAVIGNNPSRWKGKRNSVEMVSFLDANQFCKRLTVALHARKLIPQNEVVRLPSEVEWEYCCRAGTITRFSFGDSATGDSDDGNIATILNDYAWHTGNAAGNDPVVGSLKPNPWGLYDMHGYLWEFVSDPLWKNEPVDSARSSSDASSAAANSAARIIRGGSWRDHHSLLSSASRLSIPDHAASDAIGFRCVIAEQIQAK